MPEQVIFGVPTPARKRSMLLHQHRIPGLRVHLNPSAGAIQHYNTVLIVNLHGHWVRKRLLKCPMVVGDSQSALANHVWIRLQFLFAPFRELVITSEPGNDATVRGENLYAIILPVRYIDLTIFVHTDTAWAVELAYTATRLSKTGEPLPLRGELLDAVIAPVSHVDIPICIEPKPPGHIQLARPITEAPELAQVFPVQRELLNAIHCRVGHHKRPLLIASPDGRLISPSPEPALPHFPRNLPSLSKMEMRFNHSSEI